MHKALLYCALATAAFAQEFSQYTSSPPVYPSPGTKGLGGWDAAFSKANTFVASLSLEEKVNLTTGTLGPCVGNIGPVARLGFHGLCLQDGPLAIRQAVYASVFPAGLTAAASWDRGLIYQRGLFMGEEFRGKGAHVALGPVAGPLGRSAYGGRNWEGFSPDPYLTGVAMERTITAMQSTGVQACAKHFIAYEQETQRNPSIDSNGTIIESVSSNLDDRTMHELYLWPFADAVRAGVASVMCSYNRINGSYACQNSKTMNGLLKGELGFQGYVVSDWPGTHSGNASLQAGLDMDMPGGTGFFSSIPSFFGANLTASVNNGTISQARLDDMVLRIMTPYFHLNQENYPTVDPSEQTLEIFPSDTLVNQALEGPPSLRDVRGNHATLIRELGAAGTVLLKNINNTLPLRKPRNIAVFGNDAADLTYGLYDFSFNFDIGTLAVGGGSGTGRFSYIIPPLEAIKARGARDGTLVQYFLDNTLLASGGIGPLLGLGSIAPSPPDACLVFLKTWAAEGTDRTSLLVDYNGSQVVEKVAAACPNTIVITHSGGINVLPFANNSNVKAILAAHYPGQETGNSIVDILYGDINPSGKLPYTIPLNESDYNAPIVNSFFLETTTDPNAWQSDFTEQLLIDYRYFDATNKAVQYEFGFGLSYTTFAISKVAAQKINTGTVGATPPNTPIQPGGNPTLWDVLYRVTAEVKNTGGVGGATVVQLYLSLGNGAPVGTPVRVLRGFEKLSVDPGMSVPISFDLLRRDLSYWDVVSQEWTIPSGQMTASVGLSSRDIKGTAEFTVL